MDLFVLKSVPGATDTVEWTTICHRKEPFIFIKHDRLRQTSRWNCVPRKRPFQVVRWPGWLIESSHATLEAALAAARRVAKQHP